MRRNVTCFDRPLFRTVGIETVERTGGHIILGVRHEKFARIGVYRNTIGYGNLFVRSVGNEIPRDDLPGADIDDRIADRIAMRVVAPLGTVHIERISANSHFAVGQQFQFVDYLVRPAVDHKCFGRRIVVVAARGDPYLAVLVQFEPVQVDRNVDLLNLTERIQIDDRHRAVVVRHAVAARISDVEFVARDNHFFGLVADRTGSDDRHGNRIDFGHIAQPGVGIDLNRPGIGTHVCIASLENEVAAVGNRDLGDMPCRPHIHHLDEMRTVDHCVELVAVNLYVVSHIAQLLHDARITFGIDIFRVDPRLVVEIVERGLVAAHIPFVQQEKAADLTAFPSRNGRRGRRHDLFLLAAGEEQHHHRNNDGA